MSQPVRVPDPVLTKADELADQYDLSLGEAIARMCREGGYDV